MKDNKYFVKFEEDFFLFVCIQPDMFGAIRELHFI